MTVSRIFLNGEKFNGRTVAVTSCAGSGLYYTEICCMMHFVYLQWSLKSTSHASHPTDVR